MDPLAECPHRARSSVRWRGGGRAALLALFAAIAGACDAESPTEGPAEGPAAQAAIAPATPIARPDAPPADDPAAAAARAARDYALWEADQRGRAALDDARAADAFAEVEAALDGPEGDPARAMPLYLIGVEAALQLARWDAADRWLDDADARLATLPDDWPYRVGFAQAIFEYRARRAQLLGRPDEAARHLAGAGRLAAASGDAERGAAHAVQIANLWLAADEHELLEAHVAEALRAHPDASPQRRAALELCLGVSLTVRGRWQAGADARAREVLEPLVARDDLAPGDRHRARLRLAEVELRADRIDAAEPLLSAVRTELDDASSGAGPVERLLLAVLEARLARARAVRAPEPERQRIRAEALDALRAAFEAWLAHWARQPLDDAGVGLLHTGEDRGLVSELLQLEVDVSGDASRALRQLARVHALATRHRRARRAAPADVDAATLGLRQREGALVYLPAMDASQLFLVDADGADHVALPPAGAINALRAAFERDFDPRRGTLSESAALALADALLPPAALRRMEGWDALSVVGLDLVHYVPFELLPLPGSARVGERWDVAYLPDLVTAAWLAARPVEPTDDAAPLVAWVGAPVLGPGYEPIALDPAQRAALAAGADGRVRAWSGADATPEALVAAATSGAAILHVVTHGAPLERAGTGLALASASASRCVVAPADVEALPRVPPVVILSACRAARGASRRGEGGLDGLAGAFLERGAACVLIPYEDVELSAVLALVAELQPSVSSGAASVAHALREARATLAARGEAPATAGLLHAVGRAHARLPRAR